MRLALLVFGCAAAIGNMLGGTLTGWGRQRPQRSGS
jgi:predicted MFS family arabinose efflux permease